MGLGDIAAAALMGGAVGEGMGTPWESLARERILELTGGLGVCGFQDPRVRDPKWGVFALGETGDDSQLTSASARSLIECRQFDIVDLAQRSVAEMRRSTAGWGPTTREGLEEVAEWFDSNGARGRDPKQSAAPQPGRGLGNGVMMRVAPHAIFHAARHGQDDVWGMRAQIWELGQMTHADPRASIAASALAELLLTILLSGDPIDFGSADVVLADMQARVTAMESLCDVSSLPALSGLLQQVLQLDREDPNAALQAFGSDCPVTSCLPFVFATFRRHPLDYRRAVLEAINAGGDTDSNAAMVGALVAANAAHERGITAIPLEWRGFHPGYALMGQLGRDLVTEAKVAIMEDRSKDD